MGKERNPNNPKTQPKLTKKLIKNGPITRSVMFWASRKYFSWWKILFAELFWKLIFVPLGSVFCKGSLHFAKSSSAWLLMNQAYYILSDAYVYTKVGEVIKGVLTRICFDLAFFNVPNQGSTCLFHQNLSWYVKCASWIGLTNCAFTAQWKLLFQNCLQNSCSTIFSQNDLEKDLNKTFHWAWNSLELT